MDAASYDPALVKNPFFKIWITHLATQQTIDFRGWVTEFSDQFTSNWNKETVYGRMDPLATFQNTERQINLSFDVVSGDGVQAQQNLARINALISYLYPVYETDQRSVQNTLLAAPLLGMRWTNLAADINDGSQLVGYLAGATYAPDLSQGGFVETGTFVEEGPVAGAFPDTAPGALIRTPQTWRHDREGTDASFIPKVVSLQLQFTVLHKHLTGWSKTGETYSFGGGNGKMFPNANNVAVPGLSSNHTITDNERQVPWKDNPIAAAAITDITGAR